MMTCKDAAHLMLAREDQPLPWRQRLGLRFHLFICKACPRFERQLRFMRSALSDWRNEIHK